LTRIRYTIEQLLDHCRHKTRRLSSGERRRVLRYFAQIDQFKGWDGGPVPKKLRELAWLFGCSEPQVSRDRRSILRGIADTLTPDGAAEFVADYIGEIDSLINECEAALVESPRGSLQHQNYVRILADLRERRIAKLQEIGVVPKELGNLNVREEVWQATVAPDTGIVTSTKISAEQTAASEKQ
jgi:hypothetical protein